MALDGSTSLQFVFFTSLLKRLKKKGYKNQQIYSQHSNRPFEVSLICPSNCEKTIQDSIISKRQRKRPKKRRGSQTQVNSAASALTHSAASGFRV
jgi:hypothetical protein